MKYIDSLYEGVRTLPVSSYLNWSELDIEKKRKERSEKSWWLKYNELERRCTGR